ncbi:MAG: hypothetical protein Q4G24_13360 [Paracoccus sp. (in: a-proteobacteria)]|uniref:hypothetical protein n=1 Tax=Paracoccus sp. TaxID=267 RepID=UPI0026DF76A6|nr:hypothetical protein [Paracoccus sp. (in: a-proteobacteria)]MDO5622447.1 hypothetical protein [Paracoccus sp. (in: a-proteobacteria)]
MWMLVVVELLAALIWFGGLAGLVLFPLLAWRRVRLRGALICMAAALREVVPPLLKQRQAQAAVAAVTKAQPVPDLAGQAVLYLRERENDRPTETDPGCAALIRSGASVWVGRRPYEVVAGRVTDLRPLILGRAVARADLRFA